LPHRGKLSPLGGWHGEWQAVRGSCQSFRSCPVYLPVNSRLGSCQGVLSDRNCHHVAVQNQNPKSRPVPPLTRCFITAGFLHLPQVRVPLKGGSTPSTPPLTRSPSHGVGSGPRTATGPPGASLELELNTKEFALVKFKVHHGGCDIEVASRRRSPVCCFLSAGKKQGSTPPPRKRFPGKALTGGICLSRKWQDHFRLISELSFFAH